MNRRSFLTYAGAAVVSPALPAISNGNGGLTATNRISRNQLAFYQLGIADRWLSSRFYHCPLVKMDLAGIEARVLGHLT